MSGSGKSTLATYLVTIFDSKNMKSRLLDGDDIRGEDIAKLGFGYEDVLRNNLRIAYLCQEIRDQYDAIFIPVISPYTEVRLKVRSILQPNFHLVYLKADLYSLRDRDTKGLYSATDKGLINDLVGYSEINPYQSPENEELLIETGNNINIEESRKALFGYVNKSILLKMS